MAWVRKRGKKWYAGWTDEFGRQREVAGTTNKDATMEIARRNENEATLVRQGVRSHADKSARIAAAWPINAHINDYRLYLLDKGDTAKHCNHVAGAIERVLEDCWVKALPEIKQEELAASLRRLASRRSARTANHALGAVKAFLAWCHSTGRLAEYPGWIRGMKPRNERADRRVVRRALSEEELDRLFRAAEDAPPITIYGRTKSKKSPIPISGRERATIYRLAACTGFRANELRTLSRGCFVDDPKDPAVIVRAGYAKARREVRQPIRVADADWLRGWIAGRPEGPIVTVPEKTARMLKGDLARAGIEYETDEGRIDFHALRATYITLLWKRGLDPKMLQVLARHSTITLTLDLYLKTTDRDVRKALEGDP